MKRGLKDGRYACKLRQFGIDYQGRVVARHGRSEHELLAILDDVQRAFGYLPENALIEVARNLDMPLERYMVSLPSIPFFLLNPWENT